MNHLEILKREILVYKEDLNTNLMVHNQFYNGFIEGLEKAIEIVESIQKGIIPTEEYYDGNGY